MLSPCLSRFGPVVPRLLRRTLTTDDLIPMSLADRAMAQAQKQGKLTGLQGEGKPLREDRESQAHVGKLAQNMEARVRANGSSRTKAFMRMRWVPLLTGRV